MFPWHNSLFYSLSGNVILYFIGLFNSIYWFIAVKRVFVDTSVLLRWNYAYVLQILEYCSPLWGSAAECHLQLLERQVYSVARLCTDQTFLSLSHRCHVAVCCTRLIWNSNHCLFSELPSASVRVRHTRAAVAAHQFEFKVSRCRTSHPICMVFPTGSDSCVEWPSLHCLTPER